VSGLLAGKVWLSNLHRKLKPLAATLADIANEDGTSIYPSVEYVARRLSSIAAKRCGFPHDCPTAIESDGRHNAL
jgi:hypothetical protein